MLALEMAAEAREYAWDHVESRGFRRRTLITRDDYCDVSSRAIRRATVSALEEEQPDAVAVSGWAFPEARAAIAWCRARGRTAIVMSESQERDFSRGWAKERLKSLILDGCDAALVGGERHADYLVRLGFDRRRIVFGYDAVDNDHFARGACAARSDEKKLRNELNLPTSYFLSSARFIPKKNLEALLRAYAAHRRSRGPDAWELVVLGDGPLRERLIEVRRKLGLERSVHLPGFKQYGELPAYYALARGFILPSSSEQWGLVVNEAMAAGLPVLVSRACGSSELVRDRENGYTFDPSSDAEIAGALDALARDADRLEEMGRASTRIVAGVSPEAFGEGVSRALQIGDDHRRRRGRRLLPNVALWF